MDTPTRQFSLRPWHLLLVGLIALVVFAWLPGLRSSQEGATQIPGTTSSTRPADRPLRIICTFLPMYVFTLNVVHEVPAVSVELLVSTDVGCPHEYSLRAEDVKRVAEADIVVSNGLGMEPFLAFQQTSPLPDGELPRLPGGAYLVTLADDCELIAADHEEHAHAAHEEHAHEHEVNPHVWVSPREAIRQVQTLSRKLARLDPAHADRYAQNATAYTARLEQLRDRFAAAAARFQRRNIVTFHDAFAYLARDLQLNVVATLTQDPEHAPAARELATVVNAIKAGDVAAIFYEPAYSDALARIIAAETGVPLYPLNPFNSIEGEATSRSYEEVMARNLDTLQQALGGAP